MVSCQQDETNKFDRSLNRKRRKQVLRRKKKPHTLSIELEKQESQSSKTVGGYIYLNLADCTSPALLYAPGSIGT